MSTEDMKEKLDIILAVHRGQKIPTDFTSYMRDLFIEFPEILEFLDVNYSKEKDNLEEEHDGVPPSPWEFLGLHFYGLGSTDPVFFDLSKTIYEHWYKYQIEFELKQKERTLHKGTPLHQLGLVWQQKGDLEKARKYLLLAQIEDILENQKNPSRGAKNQGYRVLKSVFGLTNSQFDIISKVATETVEKRFPEEILRLLQKSTKRLPTWDEITNEDSDKDFLTKEYSNISRLKDTGTAFENFSEKLLSSIRGFYIMPGIKQAMSGSKTKEHDYDRILRNRSSVLSNFSPYVLVECKFWDKEVDYAEISKFIYKNITRRCKTGILFAKSGVNDDRYNQTIRDAYLAHDVTILVVTQKDIQDILSN